jgi:hypothetical protein
MDGIQETYLVSNHNTKQFSKIRVNIKKRSSNSQENVPIRLIFCSAFVQEFVER